MRIISKKTGKVPDVTLEVWKQMEKLELTKLFRVLDSELIPEKKDFSVKKILIERPVFESQKAKSKTIKK